MDDFNNFIRQFNDINITEREIELMKQAYLRGWRIGYNACYNTAYKTWHK